MRVGNRRKNGKRGGARVRMAGVSMYVKLNIIKDVTTLSQATLGLFHFAKKILLHDERRSLRPVIVPQIAAHLCEVHAANAGHFNWQLYIHEVRIVEIVWEADPITPIVVR